MTVNNPQQTQNQPLYIGGIPKEGALSLLANVEINNNTVSVDLKQMYDTGSISGIQAIYVDNADNNFNVEFYSIDSAQRIIIKANSQGYYPVLTGKYLKFNIKGGVGTVPIFFLNFAIAQGGWDI